MSKLQDASILASQRHTSERELFPGRQESIIDNGLYERVQYVIETHSANGTRH